MRKKIGHNHIPPEEPTLNLTPLIDVVFVVLIVFILAAPLLELDKVELAHGSTQMIHHSTPTQNSSPISIHVRADNTILYNGKVIAMRELAQILKKDHSKYPDTHPQLFHDRKATFGTYQGVKNAAEEAGFKAMDVILNPA